jgi:hypothetical protein
MITKSRFIVDVELTDALENSDDESLQELHNVTHDVIEEVLIYLLNIWNYPYDPEGYEDTLVIDCDEAKAVKFKEFLKYQIASTASNLLNPNNNPFINTTSFDKIFNSMKISLATKKVE